jgi:hypothetical protein
MRFSVSIYSIKWGAPKLGRIEYYCSNCGSNISEQEGFDPKLESWDCLECGTHYELDEMEDIKETKLPDKANADLYCDRENLLTAISDYLETEYPNEVQTFDYDVLSTDEEDGVDDEDIDEEFDSEEEDD